MENVRIAVLSAYDTTLAFLDNLAPESMHYYSDELHIYMEGAASIYTFCTNAKHPESIHLIEGNKLSFQYRHKDYYFNIMRVTRDEYEVEVEAYSLVFELLNEEKGPYKAAKAMSFAEYLTAFNYEQTVSLGINEVSDKKIKHEWTGTETLLARLYSLANVFSAEVEFVPKLNEDYSLKNIKMNVYIEHSDKDQGIGSDRTDIVLRYGKNVSGITKTSDITELYTAIRPTGKDGLTVMALDKKELDANGDVEYLSPKNNGNIYAVQAKDRFPSNLMANENERYIAKIWEYDTDNVNTLYGQALAQLKKNCVPQVQYEVEGYFDTDIGDTVTIADEEYNPPLYLQARVTEQSRSFTDPSQNKTTFDNFKELKSRIDPSLMNAVKQMVAANKTYTCSVITDNGIIFKNGEGSTTLTASVMDGGADKTDNMLIQWYKDGTDLSTGKSITVNASDISGKSVYKYECIDKAGNVRGLYEVTVSNVNDGEPGKPGTDGEDAKLCTVTGNQIMKYESGSNTPVPAALVITAEYQNTNHGKWQYRNEYDIWADFIPAQTNATITIDEASVAWVGNTAVIRAIDSGQAAMDTITLAKLRDGLDGKDGAQGPRGLQGLQGPKGDQGIPGPKGDDGKSSYTHIAYANSADGSADFSVSDSNRTYIGMYVDNTATDSTTPSKYSWSKIKGADGAQGTPGKAGTDGKTPYLHIAYANSADGSTDFSVSDSVDKLYIGQYTDYVSADSTDPIKYAWTKIKGDTGATGPQGSQGVQGPKGADGKTYYTWLKYADTPTTGMSDDPSGKSYIGLAYNKATATESSNYSDYTWSLIKGVKGDQGVAGPKGTDGKTYYTWVKYATSASGANMSDSPAGKTYIGLAYNKTTQTESTNAADYAWSLIKGDTGAAGTGYTLMLSKESYTFAGGTSAALAGSTVTDITAYKNTSQVVVTVLKIGSTAVSGNLSGIATGFSGLTAAVSGNGTTACKITFTATTALTVKSGSVAIEITVDGKTFTKSFSFSLALKGATGGKGDPTGIIESETAPSTKYTGMLWKHTGTVSGLIKNAVYRWTGTKWDLFLIKAENIEVDSLSAISANLGDVTAGTIEGAIIKGDSILQLQKKLDSGDTVWTYITENGISLVRFNKNNTRTGGATINFDDISVDFSNRSFVQMNNAIDEMNQNMFGIRGTYTGDMNSAKTPGCYWCNFANTSNGPATSGYGWLEVISASTSSYLQRLTTMTSSGQFFIYVRYYANSKWYGWGKQTFTR